MKRTKFLTLALIIVAAAAIGVIGLGYTSIKHAEADLQSKLEICKKNLSSFQNVRERDMVAINAYIETNYKRIPSTTAKEIAHHTVELSQKHDLALALIVGIMEVESGFNPTAVSNKGARGLMQVMYKIWKEELSKPRLSGGLEFKDEYELHEIDKGIEAGVVVINHYLDQSEQDISKALYLYVGKDKSYAAKVYEMMGKFVLFRASMQMPKEEVTPEEEADTNETQ